MGEKIDQSQVERFREIARMMECDEDEGRWDERLRKIATSTPDGKTAGPPDTGKLRRRS